MMNKSINRTENIDRTETIIAIEDITFTYQSNQPVFRGLNLTVNRHETIGLVGSNGAGKSSLLKLMVGLNEHEGGSINVDGVTLCQKTLKQVRQKVGFAFQDADSQLFMTTVYEDVAFGPRNHGLGESEVDKIVKYALNSVDALHLSNRPPYKLSGGEKRVVTLATVLSMRPEVIILDEPTTGLDPKARRNLMGLLQELPQTKIIATHDMDMALEICDRVIVMHQGEIVADGQPKEIFRNVKLLEDCHLEQPLSMQACLVCLAGK